ncbi:unnamed protein product [Gongylonema pulchrum]|uniref:7TM_GPCR_Srx domain-containing protein n=1 Tax=Gongylonema pulchrum TaxID=637853 RepID=A0A183DBS5_9BILA|nr:unnamed protein product [Gongylonema pulchrum]VDN45169.1 unnamed protein product [Gongylonema pulchrum]
MKAIEVTAILMVPALVLGIFGNMNLLFATFRLKQLQNRNGILIALIAFFDFVSRFVSNRNKM